MLKLTFRGSSS